MSSKFSSCAEDAIKKCTEGLVEKFDSPIRGIDASLEVINNRQTVICDKLIGENEKFEKVAQDYKVHEMVAKTQQYQEKLRNLQNEMSALTERSASMKARALRLQDCKQKEALRRELKHQQDLEREEALVARPASSTSNK